MLRSKTEIAIPPGETIREILHNGKIDLVTFSRQMGMAKIAVWLLLRGEIPIDKIMAIKLELNLGVPAEFWENLEHNYRETVELIKTENNNG